MEPLVISCISLGMTAILGIIAYFFKEAHKDIKEDNKQLWREVGDIKDSYFKKQDFTEFKKELWKRLDRMEDDFKAQLQELKK